MTLDDIVSTLHQLNFIVKNDQNKYVLRIHTELLREQIEKFQRKNYPKAKMELLKWSPTIFKKSLVIEE
jgi:hypothetical protein